MEELIARLNQEAKVITNGYFEHMNWNVVLIDKDDAGYFEIPSLRLCEVTFNKLDYTGKGISILIPTDIEETTVKVFPEKTLVRVRIPVEKFEDWGRNNDYFKSSLMSIVNNMQYVWEKKFGSYKKIRHGETFFSMGSFIYTPRDEWVYLDFEGNWASNKKVEDIQSEKGISL